MVIARHAEDISWSDPFAAVRTVYWKSGEELSVYPGASAAGESGWRSAAPEAAASAMHSDSVVLPNVGKEQHTYLTHIVRNYDSLSAWTVFLHGKRPTCGFFLVNKRTLGNHLLTNVSVLDYLEAEGQMFMPLTGRTNHDLTLGSSRSTFADGLAPRPRVSRPVAAKPTRGDQGASPTEEGGGDRWLEWEHNDLSRLAKEMARKQLRKLGNPNPNPNPNPTPTLT